MANTKNEGKTMSRSELREHIFRMLFRIEFNSEEEMKEQEAFYFEDLEEAFNPYKNMEYGAKFLKRLYSQKGNDWNKAATAYHSSLPRKAQKYAQKLSKAYQGIIQASLETKAVNKTAIRAKILEKDRIMAKNKIQIEAKAAKAAAAWREAKLAEYRLKKANQL